MIKATFLNSLNSELDRDVFKEHAMPERYYLNVLRVGAFVSVALLDTDGRWLGASLVTIRSEQAHLETIGVRSSFRGQGYGAQLLELTLEAVNRQGGASTLSLQVETANVRARQLYASRGFARQGECPGGGGELWQRILHS